jgi:glycerophosphoryl diester phosphodiesterase
MLVIGHRGAKGLAAENTIEGLQAGYDAGADMLEFDVRLTKDKIPILCHDSMLYGRQIGRTHLAVLKTYGPITTLESVLDAYFGNILLNLEYKPSTGVDVVYRMLTKYVKRPDDWDNIIISSFHVRPLLRLRRLNETINLALLHSINPFAFVAYQRRLKLVAVGWHRLHVNKLAIEIAQKVDIFTYVYTVNRPKAAQILERRGIDGVVTDYPDLIAKSLNR